MGALAVCCALLCGWLGTGARQGCRRLRGFDPGDRGGPPRRRLLDAPVPRAGVCVSAAVLLGWVLSGPLVGLVGLPAGVLLSIWIGRLESPDAVRAREEIDRDLPLAADLLAACATAGRPPEEALVIVGRALGGALGSRLSEVTVRLSLGADPVGEWARWTRDPQLGGLGRTLQRSAESGAPLADGLARLADDHRRDRRTRTQMKARNVGVKAAGPLAACFLPAFMLVGVVPTVAGSFRHLFG